MMEMKQQPMSIEGFYSQIEEWIDTLKIGMGSSFFLFSPAPHPDLLPNFFSFLR
jgi:hypothetical protein